MTSELTAMKNYRLVRLVIFLIVMKFKGTSKTTLPDGHIATNLDGENHKLF